VGRLAISKNLFYVGYGFPGASEVEVSLARGMLTTEILKAESGNWDIKVCFFRAFSGLPTNQF